MNYSVGDEVPEYWDFIISSFITVVEYSIEFNNMPPVNDLKFGVKRGLLFITYSGGDKVTDGFALLAKELSSTICTSCGSHAVWYIFGSPKCDGCT